eukprot:NODE_487_length_7781_cov_0.322572.p3 type:complete len:230 gc:universal NODE_487_length_7781_cov_0.322572:5628-6317(+)
MEIPKDVLMEISKYSFPVAYSFQFYKICERIRSVEQIFLQLISENSHGLIQWNKTWQFKKASNHSFLEFQTDTAFKAFMADNFALIFGNTCEIRVVIPSQGFSLALQERFTLENPQFDVVEMYVSFDVFCIFEYEYVYRHGIMLRYNLLNGMLYIWNGTEIFINYQGKFLSINCLSYSYSQFLLVNYFSYEIASLALSCRSLLFNQIITNYFIVNFETSKFGNGRFREC